LRLLLLLLQVIKMLIVVVTLFAVCWLPLHVFIVVLDFVPQLRSEDQPEASSIVIAIYTTVHWLAMSNSFVNPIVYGFLNDSFRVGNKCYLTI
jgi:leucokinin receptor